MIERASKAFVATILILSAVACGGGKSSQTATQAVATATTEAQREQAALPMTSVAALPATLKCGATQPVWVNLNTKSYHEAGDPYYGRTRNGQYMCPSQAVAQGYHAAGAHHHKKKSKESSDGN